MSSVRVMARGRFPRSGLRSRSRRRRRRDAGLHRFATVTVSVGLDAESVTCVFQMLCKTDLPPEVRRVCVRK
jgi:hypothetical protein